MGKMNNFIFYFLKFIKGRLLVEVVEIKISCGSEYKIVDFVRKGNYMIENYFLGRC